MTRDDILAEIGDNLSGQITVTGRADAEVALGVLRGLGYTWQLMYSATHGNQVIIVYTFGGPTTTNTGQTTWRDVDRECQRGVGGGDFDLTAKRMGLDPAEMRRQKRRDLGY